MPSVVESAEDMEERYTDLFKKLDKGGDGRIDIKDLTSELKELGVCESYAAVIKIFQSRVINCAKIHLQPVPLELKIKSTVK